MRLVGHLPVGKGVLGALRDRTEPLRLTDLTEHPAAAGFPEHHPVMRALLAMPIIIRGAAFGSLFVTDDRPGHGFSEADEITVRLFPRVDARVLATIDAIATRDPDDRPADVLLHALGQVVDADDDLTARSARLRMQLISNRACGTRSRAAVTARRSTRNRSPLAYRLQRTQ